MSSSNGLYSGFEGYRTPTDIDRIRAVEGSMVVLDTNVLLSLYGVQGTSLDDRIRVYEALGDRLFVPHQVMDEFWRNRRVALAENQGKHREREKIQESFNEIRSIFEKWYSRVIDYGSKPPADRIKELDEAVEAVLGYIDESTGSQVQASPDAPTQKDPVLQKLEGLLAGRVGTPPTADERKALLREAGDRVKAKIPPGFMDAEKNPERAAGDFLVWHQTMTEAKKRQVDVLLITQDEKEDWWADRGKETMRARPELVEELSSFAGQRLLMMRPVALLSFASHLGVEVSQQALDEAQSDAEPDWSVGLAVAYLIALGHRNPPYLHMIQEAALDAESSISRAKVADLIGRSENDSMKGLTRPFSTVLRDVGLSRGLVTLPIAPMYPWYDDAGWMTHLVLEDEFAEVVEGALELAAPQLDLILGTADGPPVE